VRREDKGGIGKTGEGENALRLRLLFEQGADIVLFSEMWNIGKLLNVLNGRSRNMEA
jgi:hypothetical protein